MVRRLKPFLLASLVFAACAEVWADAVLTAWQPLFKGIDLAIGTNFPNTVFTGSAGAYTNRALQVIQCVRIDLTDPDVRLLPSLPAPNPVYDSRETLTYAITSFIRSNRVQVAANAHFYNATPGGADPGVEGVSCDVYGLSISRGIPVSPIGQSRYASLLFTTNNQPIVAFNNRAPGVSTAGIFTAVSGYYPIVSNGMSIAAAAAISYPDGSIHGLQPRMIFGVSQDRQRLFLMSIDGRQAGYSDGARDEESAWWALRVGMADAINMDGGGSAALYTTDTNAVPVPVNRSSYRVSVGRERYIGSHLGVYALPLSTFISGLAAQASYTGAYISWTTVSNATTKLEYGLTAAYGASTTLDPTLATNHAVSLSGLLPGTNYFFRAVSAVGSNVFATASSFRTLNFVDHVVVQPGLTDATISWDTPWPATTQVEYGLTAAYGSASSLDLSPTTHHVVSLDGLRPGTLYHFRALSRTGSSTYASEGLLTTSNYPPVLVFDLTNTWRYATGNLDGITWQASGYNDSAWPSGRGFLWVDNRGPNAEILLQATSMPLEPTTGLPFVTYFFRTHFQFPASPVGASLILSNYLDDGAVFYLNGVELYRAFMPAAPTAITSSTVASSYNCTSGNATCPLVFTVSGDLLTNLVPGDNVLAVEVHNYRANSPDITFGAGLFYTAIPGSNARPVLAPTGNKSINENVPLTFVANATDPDTPKLTYALDPGAPAAASINSTNGAFAWTPTEADGPGTYTVTIRVSDNGSPPQSDFETIRITVNEMNTPPVLRPLETLTTTEGVLLTFVATATDTDLPPQILRYSLGPGVPANASIDETNGRVSWKPPPGIAPSTNAVMIRATDNGAPELSDLVAVTIMVVSPPRLGIMKSSTGTITLTWNSTAGQVYRVEYSDESSSGQWTSWTEDVVADSAQTTVTEQQDLSSSRIYRVRLVN